MKQMALNSAIEEFERRSLTKDDKEYDGLRWCELGNQTIINDIYYMSGFLRIWRRMRKTHKILVLSFVIITSIIFYIIYETLKKPAKATYVSKGVIYHVSLDINGKDRSIAIDLNKQVPKEYYKSFDVVTNYGTIEHINNQYQSFKNIHDMCKKNGLMLHIFPTVSWFIHGRYSYTKDFIKNLAKSCGYSIIVLDIIKWSNLPSEKLLAVAIVKAKENDFISNREFAKLGIIDTGYMKRTENYTMTSPLRWLYDKSNSFIKKTRGTIKEYETDKEMNK